MYGRPKKVALGFICTVAGLILGFALSGLHISQISAVSSSNKQPLTHTETGSTVTKLVSSSRTPAKTDRWRETESRRLGDLVQRRLDYLQNPVNCDDAELLVCDLAQRSGFGSNLHYLLYCLVVAYGSRRTLVLRTDRFVYGKHSWENVFEPASRTCTNFTDKAVKWGDPRKPDWESSRVLLLPRIIHMNPRRDFLPLAFPKDLAPPLQAIHGDPAVWWLGQVLRYGFRPNEKTKDYVDTMMKQLGFKKPIVGIQVRRTDKIQRGSKESDYHAVEEYMAHVDNYFREIERHQAVSDRRVFLATEDPTVLEEARQKYPNYTFVSNYNGTVLNERDQRYAEPAMLATLLDIHLLSLTDFLVCTFSSNLCRAAYELMQTYHVDASNKAHSLDVRFYFHGQTVKAIESHKSNKTFEVQFEAGDRLRVQGVLNRARNLRTNSYGYYDMKKAVDERIPVAMPTYPEVSAAGKN